MVTVTVQCKSYVAFYLQQNYGSPVHLPRKSNLRYTFLACLQKQFWLCYQNQFKGLESTIEFKVNHQDLKIHGCALKPEMMYHINKIFEEKLKNEMFFEINQYHFIEGLTVYDSIRMYQKRHGFTEEVFPFETIHRAYYDMRPKVELKKDKNAHEIKPV